MKSAPKTKRFESKDGVSLTCTIVIISCAEQSVEIGHRRSVARRANSPGRRGSSSTLRHPFHDLVRSTSWMRHGACLASFEGLKFLARLTWGSVIHSTWAVFPTSADRAHALGVSAEKFHLGPGWKANATIQTPPKASSKKGTHTLETRRAGVVLDFLLT